MNNRKKIGFALLGLVSAMLLPFIFILVAGMAYSIFGLLVGQTFTISFSNYFGWIRSLTPYFPYLAGIPLVVIFISTLLNKRVRENLRRRIENRQNTHKKKK